MIPSTIEAKTTKSREGWTVYSCWYDGPNTQWFARVTDADGYTTEGRGESRRGAVIDALTKARDGDWTSN